MQRYFRFLNPKTANTISSIILFALFFILISTLINVYLKPPQEIAESRRVSLNITGHEKKFVIPELKLGKETFNTDQNHIPGYQFITTVRNQTIIIISDTTWGAGKTITDSLITVPSEKDSVPTSVHVTLTYDSTLSVINVFDQKVTAGLEPQPSVLNNILFLFLVAAAGIVVLAFKFYYYILRKKNAPGAKPSASTSHSISREEVKPEEDIEEQGTTDDQKVNSTEIRCINFALKAIIEQREMSSFLKEIEEKEMRKRLQELWNMVTERQFFERKVKNLESAIKSIAANKNDSFNQMESTAELKKIQQMFKLGKSFEKVCDELKINPKTEAIEEYIESEKKSLTDELEKSSIKNTALAKKETDFTKEIGVLQSSLDLLTADIEKSKTKAATRTELENNLYDIILQFEENVLGSKANTFSEADYRQFILPKLLELSCYSVDFIKWCKQKQCNDNNIANLKASRNGNPVIISFAEDKVVRDIDHLRNRAYLNQLLKQLRGEDLAGNQLKKAQAPQVLIDGFKLEV